VADSLPSGSGNLDVQLVRERLTFARPLEPAQDPITPTAQVLLAEQQAMLAGHSHCGQVRFSLVPVFWLPGKAARFLIGRFADRDSGPYVRCGIGISFLPLGFR
jgi:hypothetical protein